MTSVRSGTILIASIFQVALSGCATAPGSREADLRLAEDHARRATFEVGGLGDLSARALDAGCIERSVAVYVEEPRGSRSSERPAISGSHMLFDDGIRFTPRYSLTPGLSYRLVFLPAELGPHPGHPLERAERTFSIPVDHSGPRARVRVIYPTANRVPENLLKFYIHFERPMWQGGAYDHIHLLDSAGTEIDNAFLELGEELWDPTGHRFTLYFDPGRVKRELLPRREEGPPLQEGQDFTLLIDRAWPDTHGRQMSEECRKRFTVGAPDDRQPAVSQWRVNSPAAGSLEPLIVDFGESLDHALLMRVIHVERPDGSRVEGEPHTAEHETTWVLTPRTAWTSGDHRLVAAPILEDLAGNSLSAPFEVDLWDPVAQRLPAPASVKLFQIRP